MEDKYKKYNNYSFYIFYYEAKEINDRLPEQLKQFEYNENGTMRFIKDKKLPYLKQLVRFILQSKN